MDNQKTELIELIKKATNILITVSYDPSVDQLASCIGLTLLLNKIDKHATAVFSGQIPPMLDFLQPNQTLEKNTDSLRDFIISLDRSKADKLRYKALDDQVKIYITPYKTSITDKDLEFSQGDFNVDLVIVLGAITKDTLDQAIVSHGRILHDAAVVTIGVLEGSSLGSVNYFNPQSSSISEIIANLGDSLADDILDSQIATALLTGIVASTDRFSNEKTTSNTLSISALLMKAGADQQLVATKLSEPTPLPEPVVVELPKPITDTVENIKSSDGNLQIDHGSDNDSKIPANTTANTTSQLLDSQPIMNTIDDEVLSVNPLEEDNELGKMSEVNLPEVTVNNPNEHDSVNDAPSANPLVGLTNITEPTLVNDSFLKQNDSPSVTVQSASSVSEANQPKVDLARDSVNRAFLSSDNERLKPIDALNAQPLDEISHNNDIDNDDPMAEHEIIVNDKGEILKHNDLLNQSMSSPDKDNDLGYTHEKKLEPLHDLNKPILNTDPATINNFPPPVPPPIPVQFNSL